MTSASITLGNLADAVNQFWPEHLAEEWDRVGIVIGSRAHSCRSVLLVVDVTEQTVAEAIAGGFDAVLAHHPLLLRGVTTLSEDRSKGALAAALIRGNISLVSAHTNADAPEHGVADVFAERLGLSNQQPLRGAASGQGAGIGRVGTLPSEVSARELAEQIAGFLPATVSGVRVAGSPDKRVRTVAVLPGAGDSELDNPLVRSADAYVTADLRHHPASDALDNNAAGEAGPVLLDVSHWASEWLWLDRAAEKLRSALPEVEFVVSQLRTDAWTFSVGANVELNGGGQR